MIVLYAPKSDQKTEIAIPEGVTKIACNVSGGADTAILFYILCKYIKDSGRNITILPVNRTYMDRPTVKEALLIVEKVKELLGGDTSFIKDLHSEIECKKWPRIFHRWFELKLLESGDAEMLFDGMTANPKDEDFYKHGVCGYLRFSAHEEHLPKRVRIFSEDFDDNFASDFPEFYRERPFCNVDKQFIAEMYDLHKVRDEIIPLTWSCEGSYFDTEGFTKPCETCFNCVELNWAFGHFSYPRFSYTSEIKHLEYESWTDYDWHFTDNYKKYIETKPWWWKLLNKYIFKLHI
jgi:hypothetical protein